VSDIKVYENLGYESNPPDYVFDNLEFIGTCGACPEQYDVVLLKNDQRFQVGYVRLRHGRLRVECPDVWGKEVYSCSFDDDWKGRFDDEEERLDYLEKAAEAIQGWLKGEDHE